MTFSDGDKVRHITTGEIGSVVGSLNWAGRYTVRYNPQVVGNHKPEEIERYRPTEVNCPYAGGWIALGRSTKCPKCGARLSLSSHPTR